MDNVIDLYNKGKLIVRAVDLPTLHLRRGEKIYDCSVWANEFEMMMNNEFDSVSSTLLIPNVGVHTYKSVGFLVNSDDALVLHIAKSDSGSCGRFIDGDFLANKPDFASIDELASYIRDNKSSLMNEVNLNIPINAVVGLVIISEKHLKRMLIVREAIYMLSNIYFDIYKYDMGQGKISKCDISSDEVYNMFSNPNDINEFYYETDYNDVVYTGSVLPKRNGFSR